MDQTGQYIRSYPVMINCDRRPDSMLLYDKKTANLLNDTYVIPLKTFYDAEALLNQLVHDKNPVTEYIKYCMFRARRQCMKYMYLGVLPQIYLRNVADFIKNKHVSPDRSIEEMVHSIFKNVYNSMEKRISQIIGCPIVGGKRIRVELEHPILVHFTKDSLSFEHFYDEDDDNETEVEELGDEDSTKSDSSC